MFHVTWKCFSFKISVDFNQIVKLGPICLNVYYIIVVTCYLTGFVVYSTLKVPRTYFDGFNQSEIK